MIDDVVWCGIIIVVVVGFIVGSYFAIKGWVNKMSDKYD